MNGLGAVAERHRSYDAGMVGVAESSGALNPDTPLSPQQVAFFEAFGFLRLPGLFG